VKTPNLFAPEFQKKHPRFLGRKPSFFSPEFQERHHTFFFIDVVMYVGSAPPLNDTPGIFMHKNFKKSVSEVVVIDVVVKCDPLHFNGSHLF